MSDRRTGSPPTKHRTCSRSAAVCAMLAAIGACALAACGQKGPLYLPDDGNVVVQPQAPPDGNSSSGASRTSGEKPAPATEDASKPRP